MALYQPTVRRQMNATCSLDVEVENGNCSQFLPWPGSGPKLCQMYSNEYLLFLVKSFIYIVYHIYDPKIQILHNIVGFQTSSFCFVLKNHSSPCPTPPHPTVHMSISGQIALVHPLDPSIPNFQLQDPVDDQNWQTGLTGVRRRSDRLGFSCSRSDTTDRSDRQV